MYKYINLFVEKLGKLGNTDQGIDMAKWFIYLGFDILGDLLDIAIKVIDGSSPFNTSIISNLLATGNSSISSALSVPLLPETPYLDLLKSSCDAITTWLPVTYNADLGLYTWNTNDPRYTRLSLLPPCSVLSSAKTRPIRRISGLMYLSCSST
jgi:hypothetical protein